MSSHVAYKTISVRMPVDMARAVEIIANALGKPQVTIVREAIDQYIQFRRDDAGFQERLRKHIEADLALLRSLELPQ